MFKTQKKSLRKKAAFTLVEILTAATVMVLMVGAILVIITNVIKVWDNTTGAVQGYYEGDALADFMQQDLQSMIVKRDGRAWVQVTYPWDVGDLTAESAGGAPVRPPQIMFFTPTYIRPRFDTAQLMTKSEERTPIPGSICAVKYQLSYKNPFMEGTSNEGSNRKQDNAFYGLYRAVIDSKSTFEEILGDPQGDQDTNQNALNQVWNGSCTVLNEVGRFQRGTDLKSWVLAPENFLAPNVVDFQVTFAIMYKDEDAQVAEGQSRYKIAYIPPGTPFTVADRIIVDGMLYIRSESGGKISISSKEVEQGFLAFAEISVTFISEQGALELQHQRGEAGSRAEFQRIRQQYGTTTTRKIQFIVQPAD